MPYESIRIEAANGVPFSVRIVRKGERYGGGHALTYDRDEPAIEFYDARHDNERFTSGLGQFINRYYASTILRTNDPAAMRIIQTKGILLDALTDEWAIDGGTMTKVQEWLRSRPGMPDCATKPSPLTPEEMRWAAENPEAIRALMSRAGNEPTPPQEPASEDAVTKFAGLLTASLVKQLGKIAARATEARETLDSYKSYVSVAERGDDAAALDRARNLLAKRRLAIDETLEACRLHAEALQAKIDRLKADPGSMFLPIGTVARFTDAPTYSSSLTGSSRKDYPVAGSIGVVTRLCGNAEYPIAVSLRRPFQDGYGGDYEPTYERCPAYAVDPETVEVIEPGLLPDGSPYEGFGFVETHERDEDPVDDRKAEMIIAADGFFWRFHDFGGDQGVELLQAFDRMNEMPWVGEPLEQFRTTGGISPG